MSLRPIFKRLIIVDILDTKEDSEPILPAAQPLQTLFNKRAAFSSGGDVSGRCEE